jgi:sensor histidine kinase YesM
MNKKKLYILLQLGGWLLYAILNIFIKTLSNEPVTLDSVTYLFLVFVIGILSTHLYRAWITRQGWTLLNIPKLLPKVIIAVLVFSILSQGLYYLGARVMLLRPTSFQLLEVSMILNWTVLISIWSIIYFAYQFFERYRNEEIKNLKWQASKNEIELNKLKSQLNPHFIFNSMNSIRALIDEDPVKAKRSVTQLANILRNTLMMGRKKTVLFEEEMAIVNDYIELEKTRYEERLKCSSQIQEEAYSYQIPSLMIQTLVENGIKHGISKLPNGGVIDLRADVLDGKLIIEIENTGELVNNSEPVTGFGIINTTQRLNLLYGDEATFEIFNSGRHTVITKVVLPKEPI